MTHPYRRAFAALACLIPSLAPAAPVSLDAGARAVIYDENYKLGVGGEVGSIAPVNGAWDLGLHLDYTHFAAKSENWTSADEFGGYAAAYFRPQIDQGFWLRIGPHVGYSHIVNGYLDLGADAMAVFKATPTLDFYGAVIPSYLIGKDSQSLFRIGFGLEFRTGG